MGWGDEIMLSGEARAVALHTGKRVAVMARRGIRTPRWHEIWQQNPRFVPLEQMKRLGGDAVWIDNYPGKRPYIDYSGTDGQQYAWLPYQPPVGEIVLDAAERTYGNRYAGAIILEPNVKSHKQLNKDWGWENWRELMGMMPFEPWTQVGPSGTRIMPGARHAVTANTRLAAAVIAAAKVVVTTEGGLHHCAAVFKKPCIVIRGGFISPQVTGYAGQRDFYVEDDRWPLGCGMRVPCEHCRAAMESIKPEQVAAALIALLKPPAVSRQPSETSNEKRATP